MTQPHTAMARSLVHTVIAASCTVALLFSATVWTSSQAAHSRRADASTSTGLGHDMGSQIRINEDSAEDTAPTKRPTASTTVDGIDVSGHQDNVDWHSWWESGTRFAYVKATEGTNFRNDRFDQQYTGAADTGMIRGAYHFALPDSSSGAQQANFFVNNGGGWSSDGKTLPGVLDMEYNPYGQNCYDKSPAELHAWVAEFSTTYHDRTDRWPVIYTSKNWWNTCVSQASRDSNPLWIARYAESAGNLPTGWDAWTFWQHTSTPLDKNRFNGTMQQLRTFATG